MLKIDRDGRWQAELADGSSSSHNEQKEAIERCSNEALANPGREFQITPPSYRVVFEAEQPDPQPDPEPEPQPDPEPEPDPEPQPDPEPEPPVGDGDYDLNAKLAAIKVETGGVFSAHRLPASPAITNEVIVQTEGELRSSINVPGRRTVIPAGVTIRLSGSAVIDANDVELVVLGTLTSGSGSVGIAYGSWNNPAERVRLVCGNSGRIETQVTIGWNSTDITFWNLDLNAQNQNGQADNNWFEPVRFLIAHSRIRTNGYSGFIHNGNSDITIVNSEFRGGAGSTSQFRTSAEIRAIYLDNRFAIRSGYSGGWSFRKHDQPNALYVADNQFEGGGAWLTMNGAGASQPSASGSDFWYLRNSMYPRTEDGGRVDAEFVFGDFSNSPGIDSLNNVTLRGNRIYTGNGSAIYPSGGYPGDWTTDDNRSLPVETAPQWVQQGHSEFPPDYVRF